MTATIVQLPLDVVTSTKPKRPSYPEGFEGLWKVIRNTFSREDKSPKDKRLTYSACQGLEKKGYTLKTLAQCWLAYAKFCRDNERFMCDPHRFFKPGRKAGYNFEDFLPESDSTPETPLPVAQSDLSGEIAEQWQRVIERLYADDAALCRSWFLPLTLHGLKGTTVVLRAPGPAHARYVEDRYHDVLRHAWGRGVVVR